MISPVVTLNCLPHRCTTANSRPSFRLAIKLFTLANTFRLSTTVGLVAVVVTFVVEVVAKDVLVDLDRSDSILCKLQKKNLVMDIGIRHTVQFVTFR